MDRFIVGTGRCGSTLLSRMLAENPETLSVFEYFNGLDIGSRLQPEPMTGETFAALIAAEQPFVTAVLRRGYSVAEITYPFADRSADDSGGGRLGRADPLPWVLVAMLPRLAEDPDALFEEVMAFARARPPAPPVEHHRALFDWLAGRLGRSHWIERAGSSIDYLDSLQRWFPGARFLHIHRDGREAALSMREHAAYRLPIAVLYRDEDRDVPPVTPEALHAAPTADDPVSRILASRPRPALYGRYWSDQVIHGYRALRGIDAARFHEVRFEELVARPDAVLAEVADFFELDTRTGWIERARKLVRGVPPTRFETLEPGEAEALEAACRPGQQLLGRA